MTSAPEGRLWLAETLWKLGSVQFGDFSLGRTVRNSPVFVNAKLLISRPDAMVRVAKLIQDELLLGLTRRNQQFAAFDLRGNAVQGTDFGLAHLVDLRQSFDCDHCVAVSVPGCVSIVPEFREPFASSVLKNPTTTIPYPCRRIERAARYRLRRLWRCLP